MQQDEIEFDKDLIEKIEGVSHESTRMPTNLSPNKPIVQEEQAEFNSP